MPNLLSGAPNGRQEKKQVFLDKSKIKSPCPSVGCIENRSEVDMIRLTLLEGFCIAISK